MDGNPGGTDNGFDEVISKRCESGTKTRVVALYGRDREPELYALVLTRP
jgi:hypothetical protein